MLDTITEPEIPEIDALLDEPEEEEGTPVPESLSHIPRQCYHNITVGHRCHALAVRGEYFCRHHLRRPRAAAPPPMEFELPAVTDRDSLRAAVLDIAARIAANTLDCRRAGVLLYSLQISLSTFPPLPRPKPDAPKKNEPSPEDAHKAEAWARMFLDRAEAARTGAPDPFDQPATRRDQPSSSAPQPATQSAESRCEDQSGASSIPSCRMGGLDPTPAILPTLRACALPFEWSLTAHLGGREHIWLPGKWPLRSKSATGRQLLWNCQILRSSWRKRVYNSTVWDRVIVRRLQTSEGSAMRFDWESPQPCHRLNGILEPVLTLSLWSGRAARSAGCGGGDKNACRRDCIATLSSPVDGVVNQATADGIGERWNRGIWDM